MDLISAWIRWVRRVQIMCRKRQAWGWKDPFSGLSFQLPEVTAMYQPRDDGTDTPAGAFTHAPDPVLGAEKLKARAPLVKTTSLGVIFSTLPSVQIWPVQASPPCRHKIAHWMGVDWAVAAAIASCVCAKHSYCDHHLCVVEVCFSVAPKGDFVDLPLLWIFRHGQYKSTPLPPSSPAAQQQPNLGRVMSRWLQWHRLCQR